MMKRLLLGAVAALALAVPVAQAQVQWNYTFQPSGQALATYPGDVKVNGATTLNGLTVTGACVGCSAGVSLSVPNTWTATQTYNGSASTIAVVLENAAELTVISGAAPTATTNFDVLSSSIEVFTGTSANNWTLNIRGNGATTLNSVMAVAQTITLAMTTVQGGTPFFNNVVQIDGVTQTVKWQGGAPVAGNTNGTDVYTYTITKTAASTYLVLASQVQFR